MEYLANGEHICITGVGVVEGVGIRVGFIVDLVVMTAAIGEKEIVAGLQADAVIRKKE